jgi:Mce-associated membrane protein
MTVVENDRPTPALPTPTTQARRPGRPMLVLAVLTMLAVLAALFFGVRLGLALTDDDLALAQARDAVLVDARQAAINLNTLNSADVQAGLDLWAQSTTGTVLEEFQRNRETYAKFVAEAKRSTEASVVDAAVAELDPRAGLARVLVGLDVIVRPEGQEPLLSRQRLQLEMTLTPDGVWKASRIAPVR